MDYAEDIGVLFWCPDLEETVLCQDSLKLWKLNIALYLKHL